MTTLSEQLKLLRREAHKRGLGVRQDKRLTKSKFRAMQPYAGRELDEPYVEDAITFEPKSKRKLKRLVVDVNHEIREFDKQKCGWKYKRAHKFANSKQRDFNYD